MADTHVNSVGLRYVRSHLQNIPRPDRQAAFDIRAWACSQGHDLDPDQTDVVTLHYRGDQAVVVQRLSLTEAVLSNWQGETSKDLIGELFPGGWAGHLPPHPLHIVERLPDQGLLDNGAAYSVFNGLFRRTEPACYDITTHLPIDVEAMQRYIWDLDFHTRFVAMLDDYWHKASDSHRQSLQIGFVAACNKQVQEGSLSETARQMLWEAAGLAPRAPGLKIRVLNVYGYAATDLIGIADQDRRKVVLYLPGNASPFHEFASPAAMKDWFGEQCRDADKRKALRRYFRLADTPDGLDFSGVDTALEGLGAYPAIHYRSPNRPGFTTDGPWSPREYVYYKTQQYSPLIEGDLFAALTQRQRKRSYADADFIITSDQAVTKAKWRSYLVTSINLLAPLAIVVPALAPMLALAGVAQFGLGLDQAIQGKTLEDKAQGVSNTVYGLLNALPLVAEAGTRAVELFAPQRPGFFVPVRLNEQLGYPLSPVSPPHFPEPAVGVYFGDDIQAVPAQDGPIAQAVTRLPISEDGPGSLQSDVNGYFYNVLYDSEHDAFILEEAANDVQPDYYQVIPGSRGLGRIDIATRPVTDEMRMTTLRGLGVDVSLPLELPAVDPATVQPIPKTISSIWVGDRVIAPELVDNLSINGQRLGSSAFKYRLYLSKADPQAFATNCEVLRRRVPNLEVITLEDQPFYARFAETAHFEQYQHATGGAGANYSSASDILRYPLLNAEGGLYLDVDDALLAHPDAPQDPTRAAIDSVELATTPDGLILGDPANHDTLGMFCQYNTNMIGSHPNNPTLMAISDAAHERYLANRDFYDHRPAAHSTAFKPYARRLSQLTGPGLLNDVVDRLLPRLQRLRQLSNLLTMPQRNRMFLIDAIKGDMLAAIGSDLALTRVAQVGHYHSWAQA
nr:DUF6543 domain-containing protein [uncultured Pseudomonas sp.]